MLKEISTLIAQAYQHNLNLRGDEIDTKETQIRVIALEQRFRVDSPN